MELITSIQDYTERELSPIINRFSPDVFDMLEGILEYELKEFFMGGGPNYINDLEDTKNISLLIDDCYRKRIDETLEKYIHPYFVEHLSISSMYEDDEYTQIINDIILRIEKERQKGTEDAT